MTLNLQRVVAEVFAAKGRAEASVVMGGPHFATEVLQVPFTTLRFNISTRTTPDDVPTQAQ